MSKSAEELRAARGLCSEKVYVDGMYPRFCGHTAPKDRALCWQHQKIADRVREEAPSVIPATGKEV